MARPEKPPKRTSSLESMTPPRYSSLPSRSLPRVRRVKLTGVDVIRISAGCSRASLGNAIAARTAARNANGRTGKRIGCSTRRMAGQPSSSGDRMLVEKLGQLLCHGAAKFLCVHDGHCPAIIAGDIVADADRDQFDGRSPFNVGNDLAQVTLQIVSRVDRKGGIIDGSTVGYDHQNAALFGTAKKPVVCPYESFAIDVLLQQPLAHHQTKIAASTPP